MKLEPAFYVAIFGLLSLLAAHQFASKGLIGGPIGRAGLYLALPAAVALLWKIAQTAHWWTIIVFVVASLFVGFVNGKILLSSRRNGAGYILAMQPMQTLAFLASAVVCWLI